MWLLYLGFLKASIVEGVGRVLSSVSDIVEVLERCREYGRRLASWSRLSEGVEPLNVNSPITSGVVTEASMSGI